MPFFLLLARAALRFVQLAALGTAAGEDLKRRIIPDLLSLIVLATGVALRLASDPAALWRSLLAAGTLYVALVTLFHAGLIGGADAKLTTASSFLVPAVEVPTLVVDIALAGGVLALAWLAARRFVPALKASLPYGVAIGAGSTFRMVADLCSCSDATSCWP